MKIEAAMMHANLEQIPEVAARLEQQGFDCGVTFEGPRDPFFPILQSAARTEHLEFATGVAIAFARNPMIVAQIANDLQTLSHGRFILGLGSQIKPHIERRFSMPWSRPAARMREFVRAVRAIWHTWETGERLQFAGDFYTHTLMTPVFNPGPNPHGMPRVFVAGVGPKMIEVAGEVGDGLFVHPLHTPNFLRDIVHPAIDRGRAASGREAEPFEISCQTLTMMGTTDEQLHAARNKAKAQLSFYGSTPAYKIALDHEGWGDIQPELNRMSKEGKWLEMVGLITDDMLDTIGVSGSPAEIGRRLVERNQPWAQRTMLNLYDETGDPDAVSDLIRAMRETLASGEKS